MADLVDRVALAMKRRAGEPLHNLKSLENVLVGSLGDAWPYLAEAAIAAMREPTEAMLGAARDTEHSIEAVPEEMAPDTEAQIANFWRAMIDKELQFFWARRQIPGVGE